MFAKINIELDRDGLEIIRRNVDLGKFKMASLISGLAKKRVHKQIDDYVLSYGEIRASDLENDWFPQVSSHVFISHSHNDSNIAELLAYYFQYKYGIKCFVDSTLWGHAEELLKTIDDEFCLNSNSKTYSYEKRNKSTAHIHMLLQSSLLKMMDRCECIFFLNTPSAISFNDIINEKITSSPWIYNELLMANTLRVKHPKCHRLNKLASVEGVMNFGIKELSIKYKAELSGLHNMSLKRILNIFSANHFSSPEEYLDYFYTNTKLLV